MCLAILAHRADPRWPLVLVANRDEYHDRPSTAAAPWAEAPRLLAGRDLVGGGTWLGVALGDAGLGLALRWALVTNVRGPQEQAAALSRGDLVVQCLQSPHPLSARLPLLVQDFGQYGGFNLLAAEGGSVWYASNRGTEPLRELPAGVYGLSNASLDVPWPKVSLARDAVLRWLSTDAAEPSALLDLFGDTSQPPDHALPDTGVGLARERLLAPLFIGHPIYGTRASTVVLVGQDGRVMVAERRFGPHGVGAGQVRWTGVSADPRWELG